MSPLVLPAAGAVTATAAGLIGGINIDDWNSMDASEKAKKLLKCMVMGGVVGIGAEGLRQGYNTIKKRALEKKSNYRSSLLSYMMKKALESSTEVEPEPADPTAKTTGADPEEKSWGEHSIAGVPTHLLLGGGLGLAGGLTLYHFLTDKKKKKPTGYIGAGVGGLLTGVLGAGLFKGFDAKKNDVKSDLYTRDGSKLTSTKSPKPTDTLLSGNTYVGYTGKLAPEKIQALQQEDYKYFQNGGRAASKPYDVERAYILKCKEIAPELSYENIYQHLQFMDVIGKQRLGTTNLGKYATVPITNLKSLWGDSYVTNLQKWVNAQKNNYNKPINHAITLRRMGKPDSAGAVWIANKSNDQAKSIIQKYYPDLDLSIVPGHGIAGKTPNYLGFVLNNKDKFKDPNFIRDMSRLATNVGTLYDYEYGITYPQGTPLYKPKDPSLQEKVYNANLDNLKLQYAYKNPKDFQKEYLSEFAKKSYLPTDYKVSDSLADLIDQVRILRADPDISPEEFKDRQYALTKQIYEQIAKTNGLPSTLILPEVQDPGAITSIGRYKYNTETTDKDNPLLTSINNKTLLRTLHKAGTDLNNLHWTVPSSSASSIAPSPYDTIAQAKLGGNTDINILAMQRKDPAGSVDTKFELSMDMDSAYHKANRPELGNKSLTSETVKEDFRPDGNGVIYTLRDGRFANRNIINGKLTVSFTPMEYLNAVKDKYTLPAAVTFTKTYIDAKSRPCIELNNGGIIAINPDTTTYTYIAPPATPAPTSTPTGTPTI